MEAIAAIDQRLSEIQTRIASFAPRSAPIASAAGSSLSGALASSANYYPEGTSFADVFASVTQSTGTSLATAASQLNSDGVPTSLAGYGNGRIPEASLAPLTGSSERMWAPAAQHLNELMADAKKAGVSISVTDAYRSYDDQVAVANSKGLYTQGGLAAAPGTSEHGWGLAVDLGLDATSQAWMKQHAKEYGFVDNVPREAWHWEFAPAS
jgi:LAS superfamily LD-carboxypeptidase LdcB